VAFDPLSRWVLVLIPILIPLLVGICIPIIVLSMTLQCPLVPVSRLPSSPMQGIELGIEEGEKVALYSETYYIYFLFPCKLKLLHS